MIERFDEYIESCNVSLFAVETQTTEKDRRSFLSIQRFIRRNFQEYTYLEVGSHLGGSLFPYLLDKRCASVISVDPRPLSLPDERGQISYSDNSTQRMIDTIISAGGANSIAKLITIESDASLVKFDQVGSNVRVSLIDAIHTNDAVFRDFLAVYKLAAEDSLIAFHDSILVVDACRNIEAFLKYLDINHHVFYLPDQVFLVALGTLVDKSIAEFHPTAFDPQIFYSRSKEIARDLIARALSTYLDDARATIEQNRDIILNLESHSVSLDQALAETSADRERFKRLLNETSTDLERHKQALAESSVDRERIKRLLNETSTDLERHKQALAESSVDRERLKRLLNETSTDLERHKQALAESSADLERHKHALAEALTDLERHKQALAERATELE
jgi:Methyltransferase domain